MALYGRGSGAITCICDINRLTVQRNMGTKFHKDILIFTQVTACTGRQTDGRTDSHPDFNSSLHSDHLYIYIYNPISNLISFRWYKQPLCEENYYTQLNMLREYKNVGERIKHPLFDEIINTIIFSILLNYIENHKFGLSFIVIS